MVAVQLLDKAADEPVAVPPRFVFFGVKGVGDVRWALSRVSTCSSLVSRASMTCLLGVVELFVLKGV